MLTKVPYRLGTAVFDGRAVPVALVNGQVHALGDMLGAHKTAGPPASLLQAFDEWDRWYPQFGVAALEVRDSPGFHFDELKFVAPVPDARKVICIGVNYRDHLAEMKVPDIPGYPYAFIRPQTSLAGHGAEIRLPDWPSMVDWEAELGIVVGRRIGPSSRQDPLAAIGGYTIVNDVSARDWITDRPSVGIDWVMQKGWDKFQPTGPWITPAEFVPDPQALAIELTVNGVVKQCSTTAQMIFGVREIIDHLSRIMTLEPGDIIATGTPAGVGFARQPHEFIRPGDRVRVSIETLGVLENTFS
jgi:2,4-didehydro-3-deoxy-L-rhamnonate hydrolase